MIGDGADGAHLGKTNSRPDDATDEETIYEPSV